MPSPYANRNIIVHNLFSCEDKELILKAVAFLADEQKRLDAYRERDPDFHGNTYVGTCKQLMGVIEDHVYAGTKGADVGVYGLSKEQTRTILDLCRTIVGPRDRDFLGLRKQGRDEAAPSASAPAAPAPTKE